MSATLRLFREHVYSYLDECALVRTVPYPCFQKSLNLRLLETLIYIEHAAGEYAWHLTEFSAIYDENQQFHMRNACFRCWGVYFTLNLLSESLS